MMLSMDRDSSRKAKGRLSWRQAQARLSGEHSPHCAFCTPSGSRVRTVSKAATLPTALIQKRYILTASYREPCRHTSNLLHVQPGFTALVRLCSRL